jgi:hypothetical protein
MRPTIEALPEPKAWMVTWDPHAQLPEPLALGRLSATARTAVQPLPDT